MPKRDPVMCPSGMCQPGSQLLGIVGQDGKISLLEKTIKLDKTFIAIAHQGRTPEKRFRFTTPCLHKGCGQWQSGRCGVGDKVISVLGADHPEQSIPPKCGIRNTCRWHKQSGTQACAVCTEVITNTTLPQPEP